MKQHTRRRRGLSLPFSMMFLLIVVMLTMVLVTAAMVTAAYVKKQKTEQQATLTVTSAAQTLASAVEASAVTAKTQADGTVSYTPNGKGISTLLAKYVGAGAADQAVTVTVPGSTDYQQVDAKLTVKAAADADNPYDVIVSLNLNGSTDANYRVSFRVDGSYDKTTGIYSWAGVTYYSGSEAY